MAYHGLYYAAPFKFRPAAHNTGHLILIPRDSEHTIYASGCTHFYQESPLRISNSFGRLPLLCNALALCMEIERTAYLLKDGDVIWGLSRG